MYKKIFIFALVLSILNPSFSLASETNDLELQLTAISRYLDRILNSESPETLSDESMARIIDGGTKWILNSLEKDGHFAYEYQPYESNYLPGDNIVRQAGTLYSLGEIYRRKQLPEPELAQGILNSLSYLTSLNQTGKEDGKEFICISTSLNSDQCKLGATSLALSGLLGYMEVNSKAAEEYQDLFEGYRDYILLAQKPTGGFREEYRLEGGFMEKESPYSNGEALLALVRSYQYDADPEVNTAIDSAFNYLKDKEFESPLYLWITAALKDMVKLWPNNPYYVTYTKDFTDWRTFHASGFNKDKNYCAYNEGLVSAYSVLEGKVEQTELDKIRQEIDKWHARHAYLQVEETDEYRLVFEDGLMLMKRFTNPSLALGGFLTTQSNLTQRIDFTQHCLSSYVQTLVDIDGETI